MERSHPQYIHLAAELRSIVFVKDIMMIFTTHRPSSFLKEHIEQFIYFKGYTPDHTIQRVVPDGYNYLIFELDGMSRYEIDNDTLERKTRRTGAWISGLHKDYITINALPDSEMFVLQFKAYGLYPFLRVPMVALANRVVDAAEYFGEQVSDLRELLIQAESPEMKFRRCEDWMSGCFSKEHVPRKEVVRIHDTIQSSPSLELGSIAGLINETGMSKKHFTSLFTKYTGLTPKQFQRVVRFNEILTVIQRKEEMNWVHIALCCGFYDQAHFIKEFKQFCGINPAQFIVNYKNYSETNFFPLD